MGRLTPALLTLLSLAACASDCARSGCISGVFISGSVAAAQGSYRSKLCVNDACNAATLTPVNGMLDLRTTGLLPVDTKVGDLIAIRYTVTTSDGTTLFASTETAKIVRVQGGCGEPDCAAVALRVDGDQLSVVTVR